MLSKYELSNNSYGLLTYSQRAHFLELGVIRTFEFVSALRRMTVITKRLKSKSTEIYLKGAPEILAEVCDRSTCEFCLHSFLAITYNE